MSTAIRIPVFEPVRHRRHHPVRWALLIVVALLLVAAAALLGIGWYYSNQLLDVTHTPSYTTPVLAVSSTTVTLARNQDTARRGIYGIEWPGGHAVLGSITARTANGITRMMSARTGTLRAGMNAGLTASVYQTPAEVKLPYQAVRYPDPLGPMPAWYVPAKGHTWVIIMHGYKSERREGIRTMPVYHALGMPVLDIAVRNDRGAPESPDHLYHLGGTEWKDAQAAARYALAHGATGLVLMGYSMGGNIAEEFLHHSRYASRVRAAVLDSPAVDWTAILDLAARDRNLPSLITWVGEKVIAYRMGLSSLSAVNNVTNAGSLHTPTLLFYGTQDSEVSQSVYRSFIAHARPGALTAIKVAGAGHTGPWNVEPNKYDTSLRTFLRRVLGLPRPKTKQKGRQ